MIHRSKAVKHLRHERGVIARVRWDGCYIHIVDLAVTALSSKISIFRKQAVLLVEDLTVLRSGSRTTTVRRGKAELDQE